MRAAVYARVSTTRQAQAQTIQQQLDRLRDQAALAELDLVLVTAPDRLARNYVHQVLLLDELGRHGLKVEFLDRPMSHDPHDQLLPGDPRGGRRV
jgi:site-specific DNA recombinase